MLYIKLIAQILNTGYALFQAYDYLREKGYIQKALDYTKRKKKP